MGKKQQNHKRTNQREQIRGEKFNFISNKWKLE